MYGTLIISFYFVLICNRCRDGLPAAILPLIHYALLGYSRHLARYLSVNGYVLYAKSDLVRVALNTIYAIR